ncbi:MAG: hypothetical protein Q9219_007161 [cf. Caloplaca sp. 3 TL-2023]
MALCTICQNIPINFFDPVPPDFFSPRDRMFHYRHHTATGVRRSAAHGCPMCKILACQLNDDWLTQDLKDYEPLTMKRQIIDPQQGFGLFIGMDDISSNTFIIVPQSYRKALPGAQVHERVDENLLIRHWISDCRENHESCHENQLAYCPTRLLDLDQYQSSGDVVLVETESEQLPYNTLSHCWGHPSNGPLTTTLETFPHRLSRIKFDDLPPTFQDAVSTTRRLGIPYLWIDSLCIIQDSPDDWAKEASKMANVYAGALCTLSAVSSVDSKGGFFRATEKYIDFVYRYDLELGDKRVRVFPCEPNGWSLRGPLMDRAWALQERELSNRIVHFSHDDLLWECKTMKGSEDVPYLPYRAFDSEPAALLLYDHARESEDPEHPSLRLRKRWFNTIEDYSQRKMTYSKDKLIALSGLAHFYQKRERRGHYAAGLWQVDIPSALLWRVHQYPLDMRQSVNASPRLPPGRPEGYRAPSWSWASVDGHVTYDSQKLQDESRYGGIWVQDDGSHTAEPSEYDFGAFRVLEMQTTTSHLDPLGAVKGGHLVLRGLVATVLIDEITSTISLRGWDSTCTWLRTRDGDVAGALLADVQAEVAPYEELLCVHVRKEHTNAVVDMPKDLSEVNYAQIGDRFERGATIMGLGLVRSSTPKDGISLFRRLGIIRWIREELFAGEKVETIMVV